MRRATFLTIAIPSVALAQSVAIDPLSESLAVTTTQVAAGMTRAFEALDPTARRWLLPAFVGWIEALRDAAIARGVEEIPPAIRRALTGFVPLEILDETRWRIDDDALSTQHALFQMAETPAMTLDHVVVFANATDATDPALWAHELFHVMQYREWGVEGFAERYLANYGAVEFDAAEFRWAWMKANGRVPQP